MGNSKSKRNESYRQRQHALKSTTKRPVPTQSNLNNVSFATAPSTAATTVDHHQGRRNAPISTPNVYRRQDQLFNILKHIDIELDGNIITDDIWRIVADYATGKLIQCKQCKVHFCVISEDQIYLNLDYAQNKHKEDVYFQTSAPPFAEVIYCKPCYEEKYVLQSQDEMTSYRRANNQQNRYTTYSGPMY